MSDKKLKLVQVIALDATERTAVSRTLTDLHQKTKKADLFQGLRKTYTTTTENGKQWPSESKKVQFTADTAFSELRETLSGWFDHVLTKDTGNAGVAVDVEVDNLKLLAMPLPTLLWLEKQLLDLHKFVDSLPILDPAYDWIRDPNEGAGVHKTEPVKRMATEKVQKALVLYPHSVEHPAQTQLISEDILVGYWEQVQLSGAIHGDRKRDILNRIGKLQAAVKMAREEGNTAVVKERQFAKQVFDYLLG